jgi:hypothetical protein
MQIIYSKHVSLADAADKKLFHASIPAAKDGLVCMSDSAGRKLNLR